jgi:hypothetical protein
VAKGEIGPIIVVHEQPHSQERARTLGSSAGVQLLSRQLLT